MWEQLTMVKESRGQLGVLATQCVLYRATADESFEMVDHISNLWKLQEELHIMGSPVAINRNSDHMKLLQYFLMKIDAARDDWEICLIRHYRQKEKILTEKGERIVIKNAITVEVFTLPHVFHAESVQSPRTV